MNGKPADKVTKLLTTLIDYSIFPAVLVVTAKLVGILVFVKFYSVDFKLNGLTLMLKNRDDFAIVNSYSSLIMIAAVLAGLIVVLFKAHVLHNTHISPTLSARVHEMNLDTLINNTKTIYSQSFIWVAYTWLITIVLGIQSFYEMSYFWVFYLSLGLAIGSSVLVWVDLKKEFDADKNLVLRLKKLGKGLVVDYKEEAI